MFRSSARVFLVVIVTSGCLNSPEHEQNSNRLENTVNVSPDSLVIEIADSLLYEARYDSAMISYRIALSGALARQDTPIYIRAITGIGQALERTGEYEAAIPQLLQALDSSRAHSGSVSLSTALILSELARSNVRLGRYSTAVPLLDEALLLLDRAQGNTNSLRGFTLQVYGLLYHFQGEYNQALDKYETSHRLLAKAFGPGSYEATIPLNNIANIFYRKGDYTRAQELHEECLRIRELRLRPNHPAIAASLGNLGNVFHKMNKLDLSLEYHLRAKSIWQQIFGKEHPEIAATLNNIGFVLNTMREFELAKNYLEIAIVQKKKFYGLNHYSTANSIGELGRTLFYMGFIETARKKLIQAIRIWEDNTIGSSSAYWLALRDLALVEKSRGNLGKAMSLLDRIQILSSNNPHPFSTIIRNDILEIKREKMVPRETIKSLQKGLILNANSFNSTSLTSNPSIYGALNDSELLRSLYMKAEAWIALFKLEPENDKHLLAALETLQRAGELIEKMRHDLASQGSKMRLSREVTGLYNLAIHTALRLSSITGNPKFKRIAFHFAERRKNRLLLDAMVDSDAKSFAGIPNNIREEERRLRVNIAFYDRIMAEKRLEIPPSETKIEELQNRLFKLRRRYDVIIRRYELDYPEYYALKYDVGTSDIEDLRTEILQDDTALVEYVLEPDTLIIFTVTDDTLAATGVSLPQRFDLVIDSMRLGIAQGIPEKYLAGAFRLHEILLKPIHDLVGSRKLLIVRDGALNLLPFESMLTSASDSIARFVRFKSLPYVIRKRAVSYSYSATLALRTQMRNRRDPTEQFVGFAPVFDYPASLTQDVRTFLTVNRTDTTDSDPSVAPLPGSEEELLRIESLFDDNKGRPESTLRGNIRLFLREEATEDAVHEVDLSDYRFIHFATHGFANDVDSGLTGLLLSPGKSNQYSDGIIYTGEVFNYTLNADIVVLSACETGVDQIANGEGILGFSSGFMFAGAKNLIVTLWSSDDIGTKQLMIRFYRHILEGTGIAESLRLAKLEIIDLGGYLARPYHWSPFIHIGAGMDPVVVHDPPA